MQTPSSQYACGQGCEQLKLSQPELLTITARWRQTGSEVSLPAQKCLRSTDVLNKQAELQASVIFRTYWAQRRASAKTLCALTGILLKPTKQERRQLEHLVRPQPRSLRTRPTRATPDFGVFAQPCCKIFVEARRGICWSRLSSYQCFVGLKQAADTLAADLGLDKSTGRRQRAGDSLELHAL